MATAASGEVVTLLDGQDGRVSRLVRTAGLVRAHAGVPVALVGGLAVLFRVHNGQHRATQDVDMVSDETAEVVATSGIAADNLVRSSLARRDSTTASTRLFIKVEPSDAIDDETKVEIIETMSVTAVEAASIEPERSRLFVVAHRWALESATECTVAVVNTGVRETLPVATSAAIVAMKLHSIQDRTDDRKRASDAWDLYRLLDSHNRSGEISRAFVAGPDLLAGLADDALSRIFKSAATQTRRWVIGFGEPEWGDLLTVDALTDLADEFTDQLR